MHDDVTTVSQLKDAIHAMCLKKAGAAKRAYRTRSMSPWQ